MKEIWKFHLSDMIIMPAGAEILCLQVQGIETPCIWAIVDIDAEPEERRFIVLSTGEPMSGTGATEGKYIGTYRLQNGSIVFHVFEILGGHLENR